VKIEKFEDLEVWKISTNLSILVYKALENCKNYGFRDQIQRSSVSIPSNIAEGFERKSNKEYLYFLHIAQGSSAELRTQLYIAKQVGIINECESNMMIETTREISAKIHRLIQSRSQF
jgi:four helix bundle protein